MDRDMVSKHSELKIRIDGLSSSNEASPTEITWRKNQIESLYRMIQSIESD